MLFAVVSLGLVIGSFLNVVIARVPHRRSLWRPGSACPGCGAAIAWHDNIPLLSFAALRARCRACGISIRARCGNWSRGTRNGGNWGFWGNHASMF